MFDMVRNDYSRSSKVIDCGTNQKAVMPPYTISYEAIILTVVRSRAAVGMGIPMGIPMGMGMVWVWGL